MLQSEANVADPAPCAFPIHSIMTCKQRRFAARRHPRATNALPAFAAPILDTEGRSREGAQGSPTSAADVYARAVKNALSADQVKASKRYLRRGRSGPSKIIPAAGTRGGRRKGFKRYLRHTAHSGATRASLLV